MSVAWSLGFNWTGDFLLLRYFRGIVSHPGVLQVSQYVSVESSSDRSKAVSLLCFLSVVLLCLYVYGLQQYGQLKTVSRYASSSVL